MDKKIFSFYSKIEIPENHTQFISRYENALFAVKTIRDIAIFTDNRILVVDKQGLTGKKVEYFSIPFKNVITYAIETAGTFDLDAEIKLVLSGGVQIELKFMKDKNMNELLFEVYHLINNYTISKS